jgi:hypothetical protein
LKECSWCISILSNWAWGRGGSNSGMCMPFLHASFQTPLFSQWASSLICTLDFSRNVTSIILWSQGKEKKFRWVSPWARSIQCLCEVKQCVQWNCSDKMSEENSLVAYIEIAVNKNKLMSRSYVVTEINSSNTRWTLQLVSEVVSMIDSAVIL